MMPEISLPSIPDVACLPPGSEEYRRIAAPYNEAASPGQPAYMFAPRTVEQVQEVLAWCRTVGRTVSVHSTGHDFEGRSLSGEVILHMGAMRSTSYDPRTEILTVGGGARVHDVNRELARFGRAISTGTSQEVGVAGLALGGGNAYTARLHGLTCDALLEVELCTFAGERLRVSDETDPALMRLLRGAGGGWFGVATELKFRTYEIYPVTMFKANWSYETERDVVVDLEHLLITAPRELSMRIGVEVNGRDRTRTVSLSGQLQGGGEELLARHFGALTKSASWTQKTVPYFEAMAGALHQTAGGSFKLKSRFAMKAIGQHGLSHMIDQLKLWTPTSNPDGADIGLFAWGGRIRDFPAAASCMPGRNAEYLASFGTSWTEAETDAEVDAQLRWLRDLDAIGSGYLSSLSYINFPDSDDGRFKQRHLDPFYAELQAMTIKHDPLGLNQSESRSRKL